MRWVALVLAFWAGNALAHHNYPVVLIVGALAIFLMIESYHL